ncbi:hypothetical protein KL933_001537 [Ogataea haglerorum]|uniref:DNA ligase n=1 Tax=Ogataea haglerorum TaxID=1937702 RepID=A0AAN6D949_9ASCO|nr:hypothetical protein KL933_001537 [Ogataea haglerorum]
MSGLFDPLGPLERPQNHGPSPKFLDLVNELFVPLNDPGQGHLARYQSRVTIEKFLRKYRTTVGKDILPVARLVLAAKDKTRVYMTKETRLGFIICRIMRISKENEDYKKIAGWKKIGFNKLQSSLKFADLLSNIISKRRIDKLTGQLTVDDVNAYLDKLHELADSDTESKSKVLEEVIDKMNNTELRFFFRIVLKINPIRRDKLFMYCWHPDSLDVFDLTHDLKFVFWGLTDPKIRLESKEKHSKPMFPFTPQRAKRLHLDYDSVAQKFSGRFLIEEKYNGERIQLHVAKAPDGYEYRFFSRNAIDYSSIYGRSSDPSFVGCISPFLKDAIVDGVQNCILDGEMVSYDPVKNMTLAFSTLKPTALKDLNSQNKDDPRPLYMVFDILHLNGCSLEDYKLMDRKKALERVMKTVRHRVEVVPYEIKSTGQDIENSLKAAIRKDLEGLVLKDPNSRYEIGNYTTDTWIKVKPEYLHEYGENLDLVIVGQIPAAKTTYICALRDTETSDSFTTLCGISNGFSVNDYRKIQQMTAGKWRQWSKEQPINVKFGKKTPLMWIDPKESVVIEVKSSSISVQAENNYATGSTLYAAYCTRIREDKTWETADTLETYQNSKLERDYEASHTLAKKRKPATKKDDIIQRINRGYTNNVDTSSQLFKNYVFCIMTDCMFRGELCKISELGQILQSYGGTVVRNPNAILSPEQKLIILADKLTIDILELQQTYNIFKAKWCDDCILMNRLVNLEPSHITAADPELWQRSKRNVDRYGDSVYVDFTLPTFTELVERNYEKGITPTSDDTPETSEITRLFVFHGVRFHLLWRNENRYKMYRSLVVAGGGKISDDWRHAGYVVAIDPYEDRVRELENQMAASYDSEEKVRPIVDASFVFDSFKEGVLVDLENYRIGAGTPRTSIKSK